MISGSKSGKAMLRSIENGLITSTCKLSRNIYIIVYVNINWEIHSGVICCRALGEWPGATPGSREKKGCTLPPTNSDSTR